MLNRHAVYKNVICEVNNIKEEVGVVQDVIKVNLARSQTRLL